MAAKRIPAVTLLRGRRYGTVRPQLHPKEDPW